METTTKFGHARCWKDEWNEVELEIRQGPFLVIFFSGLEKEFLQPILSPNFGHFFNNVEKPFSFKTPL